MASRVERWRPFLGRADWEGRDECEGAFQLRFGSAPGDAPVSTPPGTRVLPLAQSTIQRRFRRPA
jgi:hypothetical protein